MSRNLYQRKIEISSKIGREDCNFDQFFEWDFLMFFFHFLQKIAQNFSFFAKNENAQKMETILLIHLYICEPLRRLRLNDVLQFHWSSHT